MISIFYRYLNMRTFFGFFAEPELNEIQARALELFKGKSDVVGALLGKASFKDKAWFNDQRHLMEFDHLVTLRRLSFAEALDSVEKNNKPYLGLNLIQVEALREFNNVGLTREHLLARPWFNDRAYLEAMETLLTLDHFDISSVWEVIDGLQIYQAAAIAKGYEKAEIQALNEFQVKALMALKAHGLSAENLQERPWLNQETQLIKLKTYLETGLSMPAALSHLYSEHRAPLRALNTEARGGAGATCLRCETEDPGECLSERSVGL